MNYDIGTTTVVPTPIYSDHSTLWYGEMPNNLLSAKFEETNIDGEEELYDDFSRKTLSDFRADPPAFAHEETRTSRTASSYGKLQMQYNGHRGVEEINYRPEHFDGFLGPEDQDPRGANVDPDMKKLREQEQARMRFIRFTADASNQTTGGGRSEGQLLADQQRLFHTVKSKLKVFDRQLDGRREGLTREYAHKSSVPKQILVQSYGDYIKDYSLNPQRRAGIICKQIMRDTRAWREETTDTDFCTAKYGQSRRRVNATTHNPVKGAADSASAEFGQAETTLQFKTVGILMANIIHGKRQGIEIARAGNMDMAESKLTVERKTAPFIRDLSQVLQSVTIGHQFGIQDDTRVGKTAAPVQLGHLSRTAVYNHSTPAHHALNAEIIYKSVSEGLDTRRIKDLVTTDTNILAVRDLTTRIGKTGNMLALSGRKLNTTQDADKTESFHTVNYKTQKAANGDRRIRLTAEDAQRGESDNTMEFKRNHTTTRITNSNDLLQTQSFGDNASKDRHGGLLGSKYMTRFIERDTRDDGIAATN